MRAATVIVGAIAVSSCLIALALVLTSNSDNSTATTARQQTRERSAPLSTPGAANSESPPASGPVQCNVEVTVEGGSCFLGKNVLAAYETSESADLTAIDPESEDEVSFECNGTAPTICTGSGGVTVYLAP